MSPRERAEAFRTALRDMVASRKSLGQPTDLSDAGVIDDIANNLSTVVEAELEDIRDAFKAGGS